MSLNRMTWCELHILFIDVQHQSYTGKASNKSSHSADTSFHKEETEAESFSKTHGPSVGIRHLKPKEQNHSSLL